jgi:hypothetical protein
MQSAAFAPFFYGGSPTQMRDQQETALTLLGYLY